MFGKLFRSGIGIYVRAVWRHWWAVVISAVGSGAGFIQLLYPMMQVPTWIWWAMAAAGIFCAQFLAWRDVRRERDVLRKYNITQDILGELAKFRSELIKIQNENINNDTELGAWIQRYESKREKIIEYLDSNISPAEAILFTRIGTFPLVLIGGEINDAHVKTKSMVIRDHKWLERMAQDYARQRYRPEIEGATVTPPPEESGAIGAD